MKIILNYDIFSIMRDDMISFHTLVDNVHKM